MKMTIQQAIDSSRRLETQLNSELQAKDVSYAHVSGTLDQIRAACTAALLEDFQAASEQRAEDRLWNAHQVTNTHFRSALAKLKDSASLNTTERRRLGHDYLKFIKQSQKFYRGFVRDLANAYGGIPELEKVAGRLNREYNENHTTHRAVAHDQSRQILLSCHRTLIQLGDLSRYRETELGGEDRNWAPAVGFYDLATTIHPASGTPHNQLAIIALAEGNMFRATYYIYRGLSAEEPHPQAEGNLRKAFYKISQAWEKKESCRPTASSSESARTKLLVDWYLRLISSYYHGKPFSEREELEDEVLSRFEAEIRTGPHENTQYRMTFINIAAGYASEQRLRKTDGESESHVQSYLYFFRFNVRTLLKIAVVFEEKLRECCTSTEPSGENLAIENAQRLTPSMKRMLPTLRLYSAWLVKNFLVLSHPIDSKPDLQRDFWRAFARLLSSLAATFPPSALPNSDYMLDEDVDTLGFKPLRIDKASMAWYTGDKCESNEDIVGPLLQIRSILLTGSILLNEEHAPLQFDSATSKFFYELDGSADILPTPSETPTAVQRPFASGVAETSETEGRSEVPEAHAVEAPEDETRLQEVEAERMVNDLVGPLEDTLPEPSASVDTLPEQDDPKTPPQHFGWSGSSAASHSSYPVGTQTADVLVNAVMTYSQKRQSVSPRDFSPKLAQHASLSKNGSQMPSPTLMHPPPQASSYASILAGQNRLGSVSGEGSAASKSEAATSQKLASPAAIQATVAASPVPDSVPAGHSRVHSTDSSYSMWTPELWGSRRPPSMSHQATPHGHLGNGTFGTISQTPDTWQNGSADAGLLQWGVSNTPWNFAPNQGARPAPNSPWNTPSNNRGVGDAEVFAVAETRIAPPSKSNTTTGPFT